MMSWSARAVSTARTRKWDDMLWRLESADTPEGGESARAWLAPQINIATIHIKSARDTIEDVGPGMRCSFQGHRVEGSRSSSSVSVINNAGALSLSLQPPLRPLVY